MIKLLSAALLASLCLAVSGCATRAANVVAPAPMVPPPMMMKQIEK